MEKRSRLNQFVHNELGSPLTKQVSVLFYSTDPVLISAMNVESDCVQKHSPSLENLTPQPNPVHDDFYFVFFFHLPSQDSLALPSLGFTLGSTSIPHDPGIAAKFIWVIHCAPTPPSE